MIFVKPSYVLFNPSVMIRVPVKVCSFGTTCSIAQVKTLMLFPPRNHYIARVQSTMESKIAVRGLGLSIWADDPSR